jgi:hypothetical protein
MRDVIGVDDVECKKRQKNISPHNQITAAARAPLRHDQRS